MRYDIYIYIYIYVVRQLRVDITDCNLTNLLITW